MKVIKTLQEPPINPFIPVTVNITFEDLKEIQRFYAIFNNPIITTGANFDKSATIIRENIGHQYNNQNIYQRLSDYIKTRSFGYQQSD